MNGFKLRELERKDLSEINLWRNDRTLIECLGAPYRFINYDVDDAWFDVYMANRNTTIRCAVLGENDKIIGLVSLTQIDRLNGNACLQIMIGKTEQQGKGAGQFAVKSIVEHAFFDMNLRRIELKVLKDNVRAQNLYRKIGFVIEGENVEAIYKNGKYVNLYMMALLKKNYIK